MARKSLRANPGVDAAAVTVADLIAAGIGMAATVLVTVWLSPSGNWGGRAFWPSLCTVLGYAIFAGCGLLLARGDLRSHTLRNDLVLVTTLGTCAPLTIASLAQDGSWTTLLPWAGTAVITLLAFGSWASQAGPIGGGDVKLMPVSAYAGAWPYGPDGWLDGSLLFAVLLAAALALAGLVTNWRGRRRFAAGPLLLATAAVTAALGALSTL